MSTQVTPIPTNEQSAQQKIPVNVEKDYNCGHCCRLCPFPGAKCCSIEQGTEKRIK